MAKLHERLKQLREVHNESQRAVSEATGISIRRMSSYECGETLPDVYSLYALASHYGVSVDSLISKEYSVFKRSVRSKPDLSKIGERIRQQREANDFSIKEVSINAGITPAYLTLIETRGKIPSLTTFIRLLNVLNASADTILMDNLNAGITHKSEYLHQKVSLLDFDEQQLALELFDAVIDRMLAKHGKRQL